MRPLVTIAGIAIPESSTYSGTSSDTVDGGRNAKAEFVGSIVREDMAKVEMTWKYIRAEDWSKILKIFIIKYGGSFVNDVVFFDQTINDWSTRKMYPSDRTADLFLRRANGSVRGYTGARLALIEV